MFLLRSVLPAQVFAQELQRQELPAEHGWPRQALRTRFAAKPEQLLQDAFVPEPSFPSSGSDGKDSQDRPDHCESWQRAHASAR